MDQSARSIFRPRASSSSYQGPALPKASNLQPCLTMTTMMTPQRRNEQVAGSPTSTASSTSYSASSSQQTRRLVSLESSSFGDELPNHLWVPEQTQLLVSASDNDQTLSAWSLLAPRFTSRSEFWD